MANSQFQAALWASLFVHAGLLVISPSGLARLDTRTVLPLAVKVVQREAMPVAAPPARLKSIASHPAPAIATEKQAAPSAGSELPSPIALPAATPVDPAPPAATPANPSPDHSTITLAPPAANQPAMLPPAVPSGDQSDDDGGLADAPILTGYGDRLSEALSRHQNYPRLARARGWQGQVRLRLHLARQGAILNIELTKSSGYDVLDQQAIEMVRLAAPLPLPPAGIRSEKFTVDLPITFRLERS